MAQHTVTRIHTDTGSYIKPAFQDSWTDLEKLQWWAAVVSEDTGLNVTVEPSNLRERRFGIWRDVPGQYDAHYERGVAMLGSFDSAWSWLNGFSAAGRRYQPSPDSEPRG